jgi:LDH2 family malate/lactate/ureidoglycolate dehydrogenase
VSDPVIPADRLATLAIDILLALGAPRGHARDVAESLVDANLAGHDSHGVMKLPSYARDIHRGVLRPTAEPRVTAETVATVQVDGAAGFGHVAASFLTDLVVDKAKHCGIAVATLFHAHHTGRLGRWSERIAAAGLIGMLMGGEAQPPYKVAPHNGRAGALATNPCTWAVPAGGRPPIVLDYATSVVSIGKLQAAAARDAEIPADWLIDADGRPSRDLRDFFGGGHLLPFGGYKGYALAVIAELLAVGLSGGRLAPGGDRSSCLFALAIDPTNFQSAEAFGEFVATTVARLKAVPAGDDEVMVPGEPEWRTRATRRSGIPVPAATWRELCVLAATTGADMPRPDLTEAPR